MNAPTPQLSGLARRLVKDGLLDESAAKNAIGQAAKEKKPLVQFLISSGTVNADAIANAASEEFGTPLFDLDSLNTDSIPKDTVDRKLIHKHHALPLYKRGNRLFVAMADPTNLHALDEIKFQSGCSSEVILVHGDKLTKAIEKFLTEKIAS